VDAELRLASQLGDAVALWLAPGEIGRDGILPIEPHRAPRNTTESGELAQLGERLVCNQEVTGSSPVFSTWVLGGFGGRGMWGRRTES
jgi:hypothetical protein